MKDKQLISIIKSYLQLSLKESKDVDENAFNVAAAKAASAGEAKFEFPLGSGKMHKSTMDPETANSILNKENANLQEKKKKSKTKFPAGYKASAGTDREKKLKSLTDRYKKAKTKAEKDAAVAARQRYEKSIEPSGVSSQYNDNVAEVVYMTENEINQYITEEIKDLLEKKKKSKKKKKKKKSKSVSKKTHTALKKKAEKHNAPLGALKTVYKKGQGAFFSSGSRPGQNQHSWAMARVNSFLKGGPARKVDAAQWKQVQKHRKKKRKSRKA